MNMFFTEIKKEKRTGIALMMVIAGVLGALYAYANFILRKDSLLSLPLPPMDILLTQVYGMILVLNIFALVVASTIIYQIEFQGNAINKMYMLPVDMGRIFFLKYIIITVLFAATIIIQNGALISIGISMLPKGCFSLSVLISFCAYSFITAMPVLSFMMLVSSMSENIWIPLGIGVCGFLSGMALAGFSSPLLLLHPFIIMLKPAMAMTSTVDNTVVLFSIIETIIFLLCGIFHSSNMTKKRSE